MKSIKPIVQVMNLYSLVRINSAKSKVEEFGLTSEVLTKIISSIVYNDNIVFDKYNIVADETKPVLNIYIASDFGFCSSYNQLVSQKIKETQNDYKIIIGKKINYNDDKTILKIAKGDFYKDLTSINDILEDAVKSRNYSKIVIYYNHYYNYSDIRFQSLQVYPIEYNEKYKENVDFLIETDITSFINNLISYYVVYQLQICEIFSWAAENVLRNTMTSSSLKKLDEMEETERINHLRELREKATRKSVDNMKKILSKDKEN